MRRPTAVTDAAAMTDTPIQLPVPVAVPAEVHDTASGLPGGRVRRRFPRIGRKALRAMAALGVLGAVVNWGVLGPLTHDINADPAFRSAQMPQGGSVAVATAAALLDREINANGWTPNDPFFAPSAVLDNMPNFQMGVVKAVGRFTFEMLDQVSRTRGSSRADPDLERASGFLQFPPDIWVIDPSRSWMPTVPSEHQYRAGVAALNSYNARLASGQAVFERRADTLAETLRQVSADLGSQTAQLDRAQNDGWWVFSRKADDLFYQNKGMLYAYSVTLKAFGEDFAPVIRGSNLEAVWAQAMASLEQGSQLRPLVVLNGDLDRSIFANHLAIQGFYMKRAILQLEEVVSVLAV
ncbi:DUF2333 domain-containing protein [Meridianimarinicoccus roseus]|uniref:DUF2333 domain-containing protein n=1 Tax=Meridianimarinicoccus roseus TaxID=2072018 RepID=A0A2V2LF99_9RHOB|nr:DUF2333 domain-containing protein [Meridianimarinicoccus roseus]